MVRVRRGARWSWVGIEMGKGIWREVRTRWAASAEPDKWILRLFQYKSDSWEIDELDSIVSSSFWPSTDIYYSSTFSLVWLTLYLYCQEVWDWLYHVSNLLSFSMEDPQPSFSRLTKRWRLWRQTGARDTRSCLLMELMILKYLKLSWIKCPKTEHQTCQSHSETSKEEEALMVFGDPSSSRSTIAISLQARGARSLDDTEISDVSFIFLEIDFIFSRFRFFYGLLSSRLCLEVNLACSATIPVQEKFYQLNRSIEQGAFEIHLYYFKDLYSNDGFAIWQSNMIYKYRSDSTIFSMTHFKPFPTLPFFRRLINVIPIS